MEIDTATKEPQGLDYGVVDPLLTQDELKSVRTATDAYSKSTRLLLGDLFFRNLANVIAQRLSLDTTLAPVLATYFHKSAATNWFVAPHQDLQIPVEDTRLGNWRNPTLKEGIPFVQPPHSVLANCQIVRLQLDSPNDGDLRLHIDNCTYLPKVPVGGALRFNPLHMHSSKKLSGAAPTRRVVQILYGPISLPKPYRWFQYSN